MGRAARLHVMRVEERIDVEHYGRGGAITSTVSFPCTCTATITGAITRTSTITATATSVHGQAYSYTTDAFRAGRL